MVRLRMNPRPGKCGLCPVEDGGAGTHNPYHDTFTLCVGGVGFTLCPDDCNKTSAVVARTSGGLAGCWNLGNRAHQISPGRTLAGVGRSSSNVAAMLVELKVASGIVTLTIAGLLARSDGDKHIQAVIFLQPRLAWKSGDVTLAGGVVAVFCTVRPEVEANDDVLRIGARNIDLAAQEHRAECSQHFDSITENLLRRRSCAPSYLCLMRRLFAGRSNYLDAT